MKPRDRRNPHRLIVEGPDDLHTVVHLTAAHGVDWDSDDSGAPYVRDAGGLDGALRELPTSIKSTRRLGIVLDADQSPVNVWTRVREALRIPSLPTEPPAGGYVGAADGGCRIGVWILPDNQRPGALEDLLTGLIPPDDPVWTYAGEASREASRRGARFKEHYLHKASVRTWLAWQEQPGVPPGSAIQRGYLDAQQSAAHGFVRWFQSLFLTKEPSSSPTDDIRP